MDEMMEALSSITSLLDLKNGTEPIQAIASSVGLNWAEIRDKFNGKEFSFAEAKDIIIRFGESLKVGSEQDDDQSEVDVAQDVQKPVIGVDFLRDALLKALGVDNESA